MLFQGMTTHGSVIAEPKELIRIVQRRIENE